MRKALAIALIQFRMTLKVKAALAAMFAMPLALIIIFGLLLGGLLGGGGSNTSSTAAARIYPMALIDENHSMASALLIEALGRERSLAVRTADRSGLNKLLADTKVSAGFVVPAGFQEALARGEAPDLELVTYPGSNLEMGIEPVLRRAVNQLAGDFFLALKITGSSDESRVRAALDRIAAERATTRAVVESQPLVKQAVRPPADSGNMLTHAALGYTIMAVMMSVLTMAGAFLYERQHGTWGRLLTAPVERSTLLAGFILSFFVTGMFQFAVLVLGTRLIFRIQWGPLLPLFAVGAATVLASSGIGLFLAGLIKTAEQQQVIGVIFVVATSMLGGLFWPLDILNSTMQRIGHLTPQAWAMDGLTEVALRGGSWGALIGPIAVLVGLAAAFSAAGLCRVRYE
ncbi:MAG: ABC transporter permease [Bacillota bacterium]